MARLWFEGFEDGLPHVEYIEGTPLAGSQFFNDFSLPTFPFEKSYGDFSYPHGKIGPASGRTAYGSGLMFGLSCENYNAAPATYSDFVITKIIEDKTEIYYRCYVKSTTSKVQNTSKEMIKFASGDGTSLLGVYAPIGTQTSYLYLYVNGAYSNVASFSISEGAWVKIDIRLKIDSTVGVCELKLDNTTVYSGSGLNTGIKNISKITMGYHTGYRLNNYGQSNLYFDDIAVNDTIGSTNNSWCGNGTIISLKPKGAGNKTQWDTCEGYAKAGVGSGVTTLKITAHGLSTNDVIYNKTRNAYSIVTVVDVDTITTASITGQAVGDVILLYNNVSTIAAAAGTSTSMTILTGHNLQSGDLTVNTTRSNAIRKVIYVDSSSVYNYYTVTYTDENFPRTLGSLVTSQAVGDSIKTFKFKPYAITNHWEAVANQTDPSPKLSYIKSGTVGDIDTFDMEELVADKGLPSGATIVAVSHNVYAQEAGAGSQIKPVFRIGATDYEGDTQLLSGGTLQYQKIYETSPATSSAWTRAEVDGLEAGVKLV